MLKMMMTSNQVQLLRYSHTRALFLPQKLPNEAKKQVSNPTQKKFQGQVQGFLRSTRYKYPKSIAKLDLSYQV